MNTHAIKQRFGIIGRSEQLDRAIDKAMRVANTDLSVLIQGESGVGKEVLSKIIHQLSSRKHNTFIAINTGALPEGTINSELFGHEKGAFTGATFDRKGYFETAAGGTIFLDEIGDMPLDTQAFLLRILESGEYIRVGSSKVQKTDVRVIAASNVNLLDKVNQGRFREDLYYRLNTVPIKVPALRERSEDIYMLFRKFSIDLAEKYKMEPIQLTPEARVLISSYHWPGNVRELRNVVEQLSILSEKRLISKESMMEILPESGSRNLPSLLKQQDGSIPERELLYKVLFDMKSDLTDLKSLVYELVRTNDLDMPDLGHLKRYNLPSAIKQEIEREHFIRNSSSDYNDLSNGNYKTSSSASTENESDKDAKAVLLTDSEFDQMEVVEDNLSLEDMEKEYISKALKKYNGRRKEAADELGISERTLYRKIKQYDIQ